MTKRSDKKMAQLQQKILVGVGLFILLILIAGIYYTQTEITDEFVAGEDYFLIDNPAPQRPGAKIKVNEFFSYGCIHCKNFDPALDEWVAERADEINFERTPAGFNPIWELLGRTYMSLKANDALDENHSRIFRAIHDSRRQFLSDEQLADFVDGHGISKEVFTRTLNSSEVSRQSNQAKANMNRYQISGVPTVVIAEKYRVGMTGGHQRALAIVDYLIALETKPQNSADTETP